MRQENLLSSLIVLTVRASLSACLTCSFVVFMRGHIVTTCWWHRLWTTQVHTEKTMANSLLVSLCVRNCAKIQKEKVRSSHPGTGNPAFQKHPYKRELETQSDPVYSPHRHERARVIRPCSTFSPDELSTVKTEGGLTEESWHELVSVDLVDPPSHSPVSLPCKLLVGLLFHRGFIWQKRMRAEVQKVLYRHETNILNCPLVK